MRSPAQTVLDIQIVDRRLTALAFWIQYGDLSDCGHVRPLLHVNAMPFATGHGTDAHAIGLPMDEAKI
jgi:hypothetical protein